MLPDLPDYERFIYSLPQQYGAIRGSTLVVIRQSPAFAELTGALIFDDEIVLEVGEDLNFNTRTIQGYGYAVSRRGERIFWYDSQPHPNDPTLASTHPHHKHIPPDIKHHRVPAPGLSFTKPNLPFLIEEIQAMLDRVNSDTEVT